MKTTTRLMFLAAALCAASACTPSQSDPWADAIGVAVRADTKLPIHVETAVRTDSTTFTTEFHRRTGIYELRIRQNKGRREKYLDEKMPTNARRMEDAIAKDRMILAGLDSLKQRMGGDTARIAYYDYVFEYCTADDKGRKTVPKKAYATVTPDRRVLTWSPNRRDIHKTTGLVIPGYRKLLDDLKEPED